MPLRLVFVTLGIGTVAEQNIVPGHCLEAPVAGEKAVRIGRQQETGLVRAPTSHGLPALKFVKCFFEVSESERLRLQHRLEGNAAGHSLRRNRMKERNSECRYFANAFSHDIFELEGR